MSTIFSMSYVIKSIWLRVNRNLNAILITHICVSYVLPQLKLVRFSLLLSFSSSSLTVRTVLRELIIEFWRLSSPESCASVGISAPVAYIPVCMQSGCVFIHSSAKTAGRRHSQPHAEVLPDQSLHGDFHA